MPDEVFVIVLVAIVAGTLSGIVKQILSYKRDKVQQGHASGAADQSGVTTSELKALMQEAVEDATMPLVAEIEDLRTHLERLERTTLPEADATRLLDVEADEPAATESVRASRQRTS